MSLQRKVKNRKARRTMRVRDALMRTAPRVAVFRSTKHIYAQIIDDNEQKTLVALSSQSLENAQGDKTAVAHAVGKELARRALEKKIERVVFDRGSFLYHGRVKALAEGLREGGLQV